MDLLRPLVVCAALLCSAVSPVTRDYEKTGMNVRTVLFSEKDTCKSCWTDNEVELLDARMMLQDLVPTRLTTDFPMTLRYIKLCLETLNTEIPQAKLKVAKLAMYDALGGYLKSVVLPMLNEAYYAGNVGYGVTAELHSVYGQIRNYLQTDGSGWAYPCDMRKIATKVAPLSVKVCKHKESCAALLLPEQHPKPHPGSEGNTTTNILTPPASCEGGSTVPIPYLDDRGYPSAIAIPFKERTLFSLMTRCSVNLLPKYYILAMRCLTGQNYTKKQILDFNYQFHGWIATEVVPHLTDHERWYPGLGGVMRILETMNQKGLTGKGCVLPEVRPDNETVCCDFPLDDPCSNPYWMKIVFIVALVLLLLLLIASVICCVALCVRKRRQEGEMDDSDLGEVPQGVLDNLLSIYCGYKEGDKVEEKERKRVSLSSDRSQSSGSSKGRKNKSGRKKKPTKYSAYEHPDSSEGEYTETSSTERSRSTSPTGSEHNASKKKK